MQKAQTHEARGGSGYPAAAAMSRRPVVLGCVILALMLVTYIPQLTWVPESIGNTTKPVPAAVPAEAPLPP